MNTKPQSTTDYPSHLPLKLSCDGVTGEPLLYNDGNELKIAPENRNDAHYVNVGGPHKEQFAALIVRAVNRDHAFEALLGACRALLRLGEDWEKRTHSTFQCCTKGRAAIAQAEPFTH